MFKRIALLSLFLFSGCASLQQVDTFKPIAQLVVMKTIEADRTHMKERAAKIRDLTGEAQTFLDSASFTVPLLESALTARLAGMDLAPSDRVLGTQLIKLVTNELSKSVGDGLLSPEQKFSVSSIFAALEEAASFY